MLATYKRYTPIYGAWSEQKSEIWNDSEFSVSQYTLYPSYSNSNGIYAVTGTATTLYDANMPYGGYTHASNNPTRCQVNYAYVYWNGGKRYRRQTYYYRDRTAAKGAYVDTVQLEYSSSIPVNGVRASDGYWYEIQNAVTYERHYNKQVNFRNPTGWTFVSGGSNSTGRTGMSTDSFTFDNTNGFKNTGTVEYKELETTANIYYYSPTGGTRWERTTRNGDPAYKYWNFNSYTKTCQYDEVQGDYYQDVIAPLGQFTIGVKNADGYWYVLKENSIALSANVGGQWKDLAEGKVNVGGQWKDIEAAFANIGGVWKQSN